MNAPIQCIDDDHVTAIGDAVKAALKESVMAAWENGSITGLEAWWFLHREGLQHK